MKHDEHVNKMKLNQRFSKKIQTVEYLSGPIVKGNVAVALRWISNSETWNTEAALNNAFWFWEKIDWQAWLEDWKRHLLDFIGKGKKWDGGGGAGAGFESLTLMTDEGIEKKKSMRFVGQTEI